MRSEKETTPTMAKDQAPSSDGVETRPPLVTAKHLSRALQIFVGWLVAGLLPERCWWPLALAFARIKVALRLGKTNRRFDRLAMIFGRHLPEERRRRIVIESFAHGEVAHLQRCRENWFKPWRTSLAVTGLEHVDAALAGGRGAVLWVSRFVYSDLLTKKGLHQAGLPVHHISRPSHGFDGSRLAECVLDPFWVGPERRHLAERIIITKEASAAATRRMRRLLKDNAIVSVTIGHVGRQWCLAPFFEARAYQATGPANLALNAGAPLLPVVTIGGAGGGFEVHIGPPLAVPPEGKREARFEAMAGEMMRRLEPFALAEPAQFMFWRGRYDPTGGEDEPSARPQVPTRDGPANITP